MNAGDVQQEQLQQLLSKAGNTAFGQYYGFKVILGSKDLVKAYQAEVPLFTYDTMCYWWVQQQTYPNSTWPGMPPGWPGSPH